MSVVLLFGSLVSASSFGLTKITLNNVDASQNTSSVVAGNNVVVETHFASNISASNIKVSLELNGLKKYAIVTSAPFDVEAGYNYMKLLTLKIPYDLTQELSNTVSLEVKIWGGNTEMLTKFYNVRVQRPSYSVKVMSIDAPNEINAGSNIPVDISFKNFGYDDLNDLYLQVSIPQLNIVRNVYFGDLVPLNNYECFGDSECNSTHYDHMNTNNRKADTRRLYIQIPSDVSSGSYLLKTEVENQDTNTEASKQIFIQNSVPSQVIQEEGSLLFINPAKNIQVYQVTEPSGENVSVVVLPESTKKLVMNSNGKYNVLANGKLLKTFFYTTSTNEGNTTGTSKVLVNTITILLAVIFLILLIILIFLLTKGPKKKEDLGESYY